MSRRAAARYLLTGEVFDGSTAAAIGLVTEAVPADTLDATVSRWCDALVRGAPAALAATKDLLQTPTRRRRAERPDRVVDAVGGILPLGGGAGRHRCGQSRPGPFLGPVGLRPCGRGE